MFLNFWLHRLRRRGAGSNRFPLGYYSGKFENIQANLKKISPTTNDAR